MDAPDVDGGEQLELTLGPLYLVTVDDRVNGPLTGRPARTYRSPPQSLDDARCLAALLLDRGGDLEGEGPWRSCSRRTRASAESERLGRHRRRRVSLTPDHARRGQQGL